MRIVLLLGAVFALSVEAVPVQEVETAEMHQSVFPRLPWMLAEPLAVEPGVFSRSSCPPGWSKFGSRCFIFVRRESSWVESEKYCITKNANLASIHNPEEYEFIQEMVRASTGRFLRSWLGGNDAVKDDAWIWSDGSGFFFQHWAFGEPYNAGNERCIVMNQPDDFLWGDVNCDLRLPFVCATRPV